LKAGASAGSLPTKAGETILPSMTQESPA